MEFTKFETLIRKEFIEVALSVFSPQISYRREYIGQHYPGYEIGVSTNLCKFLLVWEEGGGIMIGPLTNSFENTRDNWFSLERIICFITHQPYAWNSPYQSLSREEKISYTIKSIRDAFVPHANEIITMFSSEAKMSEWVLDFENYTDEQFRLKYPNFYEQYKKQKPSQNNKL